MRKCRYFSKTFAVVVVAYDVSVLVDVYMPWRNNVFLRLCKCQLKVLLVPGAACWLTNVRPREGQVEVVPQW